MMLSARIARGMKLGLPRAMAARLARLTTPQQVQDFICAIPMNHEIGGGTSLSVAEVLKQNRAHCIEGAFVAACAFWMNGQPALLMDMGADDTDDDHVIALFKRGKYWGAVSKSNGPYLRYRDPVYRSLRELALSFFPEYTKARRKTLRNYSVPVDLGRVDPNLWVTHSGFCSEVIDLLIAARHFNLLPPGKTRYLRKSDPIEVQAQKLREFKPPT
jgi:hypothetical protein